MCWSETLVIMLRAIIGDLGDTPTYSDERLETLLMVAASYVLTDLDSSAYEINITEGTITPNPVEYKDTTFINLTVLKAACLADQSTFRTKALLEGIRATAGPASLIIQGNLSGFKQLLEIGPCKAYEDLLNSGTTATFIRGVLSPFTSDSIINFPRAVHRIEDFR